MRRRARPGPPRASLDSDVRPARRRHDPPSRPPSSAGDERGPAGGTTWRAGRARSGWRAAHLDDRRPDGTSREGELHEDVGAAVEAEPADVDGRRRGQRSRPAGGWIRRLRRSRAGRRRPRAGRSPRATRPPLTEALELEQRSHGRRSPSAVTAARGKAPSASVLDAAGATTWTTTSSSASTNDGPLTPHPAATRRPAHPSHTPPRRSTARSCHDDTPCPRRPSDPTRRSADGARARLHNGVEPTTRHSRFECRPGRQSVSPPSVMGSSSSSIRCW